MLLAATVALSPSAMPFVLLVPTVAARPIATPDCAAALDWPPSAIESCALACAPFVALLPIAIAPAPDAIVEFAYESGVVPLPPAPPMATEFSALAVLPKPSAVAAVPLAVVSRPAAVPHSAAELRKPIAVPPVLVTCANAP
ncbi:hypothetical protein BW21_5918 [Burkholderia humptydooensis]|nr:hypothetical protein BW21_5918 [Burkholderia sp. 2002721687]